MLKYNGRIISKNDRWIANPPVPPSFDEVTIGDLTWTAKNLSIDDGGDGIYTFQVSYDGGQTYVTEYYYTYEAAQRVAASIPGWRMPTKQDWESLISSIGGTSNGSKLKSTYGWGEGGNGTDDYGFTALPAGYARDSACTLPNYYCSFGTSTPASEPTMCYAISIISMFTDVTVGTTFRTDGSSIRLVKDV